jgi:hypothetical protein
MTAAALLVPVMLLGVLNPAARGQPLLSDRDAPRGRARVELARTNVVRGATGWVPVVLREDASLNLEKPKRTSAGPARDVSIAPAGRFAALVLVQDPPQRVPRLDRFVVAARFGLCKGEACDPGREVVDYTLTTSSSNSPARLEAGRYRLYLITDGAETTATLRLHGPRRERAILSPTEEAPASVKAPEPVLNQRDGNVVWSAGDSYYSGRFGFSISAFFIDAENFGGGTFGICQYDVLTAPPPQMAYGPHCSAAALPAGSGYFGALPSAEGDSRIGRIAVFGYHDRGLSGANSNVTGERGLGAWIASSSSVRAIWHVGMFLPLAT